MDIKQEIFMRLVVGYYSSAKMDWGIIADCYDFACDAERYYREHEQLEASEREAVKMEREGKLIRELKEGK